METNEKYDYEESMISDIIDWLHEQQLDETIKKGDFDDDDYETIYDQLWTEDSVTGNASGSYWFSTWRAEEAICHNLDLYIEACEEMGMTATFHDYLSRGAEYIDVTIRCYLLGRCLDSAIERIEFQGYAERSMEIPF